MKKYISILTAVLLMGVAMTSCLDEQLPNDDGATADQVAAADKLGLVNGLTQYMNTPYADYSSSVYTGIGYPEHVIWHDVMTQDMPILSTDYNYWQAYTECLYMGNYAWQSYYWWYYYALAFKAQLVIQNCERGNEADALAYATGLAYRAFTYFDMTRMYEFKKTGTSLDSYYDDLKGLTVPIINENSDENLAKQNPRAPFYEMYRFILNDLQLAEEAILLTKDSGDKNYASPGMIYGLAARFWLELGTRFDRHPEDLAEQIAHDADQWAELGEGYQELPAIGCTSANDAFAKAAEYARKAINCGYSPLTESQWYDTSTGFNTANSDWMWAVMISASDKMVTYYTWESWVSFMCPEASWGMASCNYRATFMIDAALYKTIPDADWRKMTWVDPADWVDDNATVAQQQAFEQTFEEKYSPYTLLSFDDWSQLGAYVGFKFRAGSGNIISSTTGNKVDIPLMRVEEMYFIEAEAIAHTQGIAAGASALQSFVNSYRYTDGSYKCTASSQRAFETELVRQKRIEFWGEGVCLYDYKRLEMAIERGYTDSNHPKSYQYNSYDGYVAPWTTLYIPLSESQLNTSLKLNPDPSTVMLSLKNI